MSGKAMGFHVHSGGADDALRAYIDRVRPTVMKWLDDDAGTPVAAYAKARGALTVLRVYESNQQLGAEGGRYIRRITETMRARPDFMVAESMNEQYQEANVAARRAAFDIELMQAMDSIGRKAGILCASTGQPEADFWPGYLPALRYAAEHGHYVCWHEYGGGPAGMKWGVGENQQAGFPPGFDPCESATRDLLGWWVLRYRRHVAEWRRLGLTTIPRQYIGEGGLDDIWPRPGHGGKGYKDYVGEHPPTIGDYAAQWAWTCRRWAEDDYMVGGVDFGWATRDPQWSSFDVSTDVATLDRLTTEMARLPADVPPPPPPEEKPMILGIDVSHWQGPVDWTKAAAQGVRFAWIKAGEGTSGIDPRYHENARAADAAGILWGPYHYWRAGMPSQAQAAHFAGIVRAGPAPRLAPACDLEDTKSTPLVTDVRLYVDSVQAAFGVVPVIYTARWWWNGYLQGAATAGTWAASHPLWVASYTGDPTRAPSLPTPWTAATIHQYTNALDGPRFGATSAKLDGNSFRGTDAELVAAVGAAGMPAPGPALDVAELVRQVEAAHAAAGIRLNPQAALQRAMRADGLVPTLNEADYTIGGQAVVATRGESMAGGQATVYWWDAKTGKAMKRAVT